MFEKLVSQSVQLIKEALLPVDNTSEEGGDGRGNSAAATGVQAEEDILHSASEELETLIQNVLSSFAFALESAAVENYSDSGGDDEGVEGGGGTAAKVTPVQAPPGLPSDSTRLLLCRNNCRYTRTHVLPKIQKSFQEVGHLSLERPIAEASKCYNVLDGKLFEAYLELRCDPLVAAIEPSMYVGKFDWARCPKPTDARDYIKEIIHNLASVHSEVAMVTPMPSSADEDQAASVLRRAVTAVAEEVNRLFCCINRMNSNGCIQAWVDIHCLRDSVPKSLLTRTADDYLTDAARPLYELERPGDKEAIGSCVGEFNKRMRLHVAALKAGIQ